MTSIIPRCCDMIQGSHLRAECYSPTLKEMNLSFIAGRRGMGGPDDGGGRVMLTTAREPSEPISVLRITCFRGKGLQAMQLKLGACSRSSDFHSEFGLRCASDVGTEGRSVDRNRLQADQSSSIDGHNYFRSDIPYPDIQGEAKPGEPRESGGGSLGPKCKLQRESGPTRLSTAEEGGGGTAGSEDGTKGNTSGRKRMGRPRKKKKKAYCAGIATYDPSSNSIRIKESALGNLTGAQRFNNEQQVQEHLHTRIKQPLDRVISGSSIKAGLDVSDGQMAHDDEVAPLTDINLEVDGDLVNLNRSIRKNPVAEEATRLPSLPSLQGGLAIPDSSSNSTRMQANDSDLGNSPGAHGVNPEQKVLRNVYTRFKQPLEDLQGESLEGRLEISAGQMAQIDKVSPFTVTDSDVGGEVSLKSRPIRNPNRVEESTESPRILGFKEKDNVTHKYLKPEKKIYNSAIEGKSSVRNRSDTGSHTKPNWVSLVLTRGSEAGDESLLSCSVAETSEEENRSEDVHGGISVDHHTKFHAGDVTASDDIGAEQPAVDNHLNSDSKLSYSQQLAIPVPWELDKKNSLDSTSEASIHRQVEAHGSKEVIEHVLEVLPETINEQAGQIVDQNSLAFKKQEVEPVLEVLPEAVVEQVGQVVQKVKSQVNNQVHQVRTTASMAMELVTSNVGQVGDSITSTATLVTESISMTTAKVSSSLTETLIEGFDSDDEFEAFKTSDLPEFRGRRGLENYSVLQEDQGLLVRIHDFYFYMLKKPFPEFAAWMFAAPISLSVLFTLLYLPQFQGLAFDETARSFLESANGVDVDLGGSGSSIGLKLSWITVFEVFMFSLSLSTGLQPDLAPLSPYTLVVANVNALLAQLIFAFLSAAVFARLSQPSQPVRFSEVVLICSHNKQRRQVGQPLNKCRALMSRCVLAGPQPCELVDVKVDLMYKFNTATSGDSQCRGSESLKLVRPQIAYLEHGMLVRHIIDESSPLHGQTPESLRQDDAIFVLSVALGLSGIRVSLLHYLYNRRFLSCLTLD